MLRREVQSHKAIYILLGITLVLALFIRVYKLGTTLGFYFDQGRDALVVWDLLRNGNFFLIGPTTGIAGIFRGPIYYYLIAPFYWLGNGDPVWPAVFLASTSVAAIALAYYLGYKLKDRTTGLFAAIIASFSFYMVMAGQWLSNPTPMLLVSMFLIWSLFLVSEGKSWAWIAVSSLAGLSLFHFGSSGELFYFLALGVFVVWQRKSLTDIKIVFLSLLAFLLTIAPLVVFDIRNDHILFKNIYSFIFEQKSFGGDFWQVFGKRLTYFYSVFSEKIFLGGSRLSNGLLFLLGAAFLFNLLQIFRNPKARIVLLVLIAPVIGFIFFQGNEGNLYGYYMTGYFMIFILLLGYVLRLVWGTALGKLFVAVFFTTFLAMNLPIVKAKITDNADGPTTILLGAQKRAVEWAYKDASGEVFNVDVYVPPVIPYTYDYLFVWYEVKPEYTGRVEDRQSLLYTMYEYDERTLEALNAWLVRQDTIGKVEYSENFGGITVQRRKRVE